MVMVDVYIEDLRSCHVREDLAAVEIVLWRHLDRSPSGRVSVPRAQPSSLYIMSLAGRRVQVRSGAEQCTQMVVPSVGRTTLPVTVQLPIRRLNGWMR